MTRQTTLSLLAAAAFGLVMAATTAASGEAPQGGRPDPIDSCTARAACVARCAPPGSPPERIARCRSDCMAQVDPMDCQYARRPPTTATLQAAPLRRR